MAMTLMLKLMSMAMLQFVLEWKAKALSSDCSMLAYYTNIPVLVLILVLALVLAPLVFDAAYFAFPALCSAPVPSPVSVSASAPDENDSDP